MNDEVQKDANKLKTCRVKGKTVMKVLIFIYAVLRFVQATTYLFSRARIISPSSALAITVIITNVLLLTGTIGESEILLEIWMVWTVLKFGAMIFSVFNLDFENYSFFSESIFVNATISSSKYIWLMQWTEEFDIISIKNQILIQTFLISVFQLLSFMLVLKLHKTLSQEDDDHSEYFTDFDDKRSRNLTDENHGSADDAVAFEPYLFTTNILLHH